MDILGSVGQLYTFVLLVLLFLGSGLAIWSLINSIMNYKMNKNKIIKDINTKIVKINNNKIIGGFRMKNSSSFIKLAVFSFVGIIISAAILMALPNTNANAMNNMNTNANGMYMQTNANGQAGIMQGMTSNQTQSNMNGNVDMNSIQQQLYYMQQQLNQMQSQINNNSMGNMQSQSMSGNSSMNSSMNSSNMNSSNMNSNMNNSNSNNSNMNSSSSSSMPMM